MMLEDLRDYGLIWQQKVVVTSLSYLYRGHLAASLGSDPLSADLETIQSDTTSHHAHVVLTSAAIHQQSRYHTH
jgi:hypothetical protein